GRSGTRQGGAACISRRKAQPLASEPGTSATVLVALAITDGTAVKSDGKVRRVPPPATELMAPAATAAKHKRRYVLKESEVTSSSPGLEFGGCGGKQPAPDGRFVRSARE